MLMLGGNGGETPPRRPFFGTSDVRFLERALGRTYNLSWRPGSLLSDHRRAVFLTWLWPRALQLLGRSGAPEGAPRGAAGRIVSALTGWARPHTDPVGPARGFLRPLPPPEWLPTRVLAYGDQIRDEMDLLVKRGPESLEDRNLETGDWAGSGRGHPASDHAARKLADRSSQGVGSPQPTVGGSPVRRPGPGLPSPGT